MTRRLTDLTIKALKVTNAYYEVADASGMRVGIFPSGVKSFLTRYRRPTGKATAKLTHGRYGQLTLAAARVAHAQAVATVAAGVDPGESRKRDKADADQAEAARRSDTIDRQVELHLDRVSQEVGISHARQARLALGRAVQAWHGRPVSEISRRDVRELGEAVAAQHGAVAANRGFGHIRRFFNEMVARDVIAVSPCVGLRRPVKQETARDRVLSPAEIKALWHALDAVGGPNCDAIRLLLLTGQRRGEVAGMAWSEIDGDVWTLPKERTKNGRAHVVPLSPQALAIIAQQPRTRDHVFGPHTDFPRSKQRIDAVMKPAAPWTIHDIRRSVASHLAALGVALPTIEKILNHASGSFAGIVGIYQRHDFASEKRDALVRWGHHLERVVKGEEPGKLIQLRG
jgi:integrase